jgi:hypothetical protein
MGLVDKNFDMKKFEDAQDIGALIKEDTGEGHFDESDPTGRASGSENL